MAADRVLCSGDGLKFGYINQPIYATVDTRRAGPGELTVSCTGPDRPAFCELRDHRDGTFTLTVRAQEVGRHFLAVKYDNSDVPGSPFMLRVSPASLVKVHGPGLTDGLFEKSEFVVEADDPGLGQGDVKVRVGGPRGAFRVQTTKRGRRELGCRYDPVEPGIYVINVMWDGDHVPGSPFQAYRCKTERELSNYKRKQEKA